MNRLIVALTLFLAGALTLSADIRDTLDRLVTLGNEAYELSQRDRILECADSISALLESENLDSEDLKDYTVSMLKLYGNYHYEEGDMERSEACYLRAGDIIKTNPNTSFHGSELPLSRDIAQLYYRLGKYATALDYLDKVNDRLEDGVYRFGGDDWLITRMTYAITLARLGRFDEALRIAGDELKNTLDKSGLAYAKARRMYAKILLLADADKKGRLKAYKDYFAGQKKYAASHFASMSGAERSQYWQTLRPFIADCFGVADEDPAFAYDVALFAKGLLLQLERVSGYGPASEQALRSLGFTTSDIRKKLGKRDAAVEFVEYEKGGVRRMAALVLKKDGKVGFFPIGSPELIDNLTSGMLDGNFSRDKNKLYSSTALQEAIWTSELLDALKDADRIYFAPDGYLHLIAVEYFPQVEDKEIYRLTSTRRLMESPALLGASEPMLLFGSIDYDYHGEQAETDSNDSVAFSRYRDVYFPMLDNTANEALDVYALRSNPDDKLLVGDNATEIAFRDNSGNYGVILLSTHGDFGAEFPVVTDVKESFCDDDMSANIFALAGVNHTLSDMSFESDTHCDGLVSAAELSGMDLANCKLFCIAACQSGIGHLTADGIFGLQRGVKNAGAGAIIVSLWEVSSTATSILMTELFRNIGEGMAIHKAFSEARRYLKSANHQYYDAPKYSDAFILIDGL